MANDNKTGDPLEVGVHQSGPIPLAADFSCEPGEVLALVGPSGSGKTTLLRAIAGLYHPNGGRITCGGSTWFDSERAIHLAPQQRRVGFVFQDYALFPHLTVADNVGAAIDRASQAGSRDRVAALLAQVNLSGLEHRRPHTLSGGQQQRVAIARALAREPDVLLLDEPFSAVDQVTRRKLRRELAELRRALHIPVVLVTHDLEEAGMLADRMCILRRGKTLQTGQPFDVMLRPATVEVARLVDLENLFEGVVVAQREDATATLLTWQGFELETRYQSEFAVGESVHWVIPSAAVIMHRRDRPSRGERENPIDGTIQRFVPLGENASVTMRVAGTDNVQLSFTVPTHVAKRNRVAEGGDVRVSLLSDSITLMPWAPEIRTEDS